MGGRSLDDSDEEDGEEEGENRIHPRNCAFYNTKLRKKRLSADLFRLNDVNKYLTI